MGKLGIERGLIPETDADVLCGDDHLMIRRHRLCHTGYFRKKVVGYLVSAEGNGNPENTVPDELCGVDTEFGRENTVISTGRAAALNMSGTTA